LQGSIFISKFRTRLFLTSSTLKNKPEGKITRNHESGIMLRCIVQGFCLICRCHVPGTRKRAEIAVFLPSLSDLLLCFIFEFGTLFSVIVFPSKKKLIKPLLSSLSFLRNSMWCLDLRSYIVCVQNDSKHLWNCRFLEKIELHGLKWKKYIMSLEA